MNTVDVSGCLTVTTSIATSTFAAMICACFDRFVARRMM